jgi:hypothetical protein
MVKGADNPPKNRPSPNRTAAPAKRLSQRDVYPDGVMGSPQGEKNTPENTGFTRWRV